MSLPAIAADLDAGSVGVQWIVNGYLLPLAALVLIGGALGDRLGRKRVFIAGLIVFAVATIPAQEIDESDPPDWTGAALATVGLGAIAWGLTRVSQGAMQAGALPALAGLSVIAAFFWVEHRKRDAAMMPLALFGTRVFTGVTLLTFLLYAALGGFLLLVPVLLIGQGWSATAAGTAMAPLAAIMGLGSRYVGALAGRVGARLPLTVGPVIAGLGFALFA